MLRSALYAFFDFRFMALCGSLAIHVTLILAMLLARFYFALVKAVLAAMYLPCLVPAAILLLRMRHNSRKMVDGGLGP